MKLPSPRILRLFLAFIIIVVLLAAAVIFWLSRNLTHLVEQALRRTYGQELSLGRVEAGWNRVLLHDLRLKRPEGGVGGDRISIGKVVMTPRFSALFSRRIEIDLLRLEHPRLLIEIAPDGTLINPFTPRPVAVPVVGGTATSPLPTAIGRMEIDGGEIVFLDRSSKRLKMPGVSNPREGFHLLPLTDLWFHAGRLEFPLKGGPLPVSLFLAAPGPGSLRISGTFDPVTLDTQLKITLSHWDLTRLRPYYLKPGNLDVTHGFLDGDATVSIVAKKLHAPGEIRIKGLEVARTGSQGMFLGMSAKAFLSVMKNDKGEIRSSFLLDGDLNNPRYKVRQSLVAQIGGGLAHKLGVPVVADVGSGIINLGKKGIGGIRSLFGGGK